MPALPLTLGPAAACPQRARNAAARVLATRPQCAVHALTRDAGSCRPRSTRPHPLLRCQARAPRTHTIVAASGSSGTSSKILTLPTILTLARVVAIPALVACWFTHRWAAAAALFLSASITDFLDGYLARKLNASSAFGAFLDPVADKLMVATVLILNGLDTVPAGPLAGNAWLFPVLACVIIGREITMSALREWAAAAGPEAHGAVAVSWTGKWKTATQMASLTLLLGAKIPELGGDVASSAAAAGVALLIVAAGLTVWSLMEYFAALWKFMARASLDSSKSGGIRWVCRETWGHAAGAGPPAASAGTHRKVVRGKYRGGGRRGGAPRKPRDASDSEGSSSGAEYERVPRGQNPNMGMLPPSDSDTDSDSDDDAPRGGQNPNMGLLPPSDSDSESGSEDEAVKEAKPKKAPKPLVADAPRRRKDEEEVDPEQARVDLERLELIKKKREEQRLARIAAEGWDRFAPITETNKPPLPADHPSVAGK